MTSESTCGSVPRNEKRRRSRAAILAAARQQFGEFGFERATIRGVAAVAGVDPGLVMQHFGSKLALFAAAAHSDVVVEHTVTAGPAELPHAALQDVFSQFEDPDNRAAAVALMRNCLTHPQATEMMRDEVMSAAMLATGPRVAAVDDAELRSAMFNACVMGLILARYVIGVEPLASAATDDVMRLFEPALHALVDEVG